MGPCPTATPMRRDAVPYVATGHFVPYQVRAAERGLLWHSMITPSPHTACLALPGQGAPLVDFSAAGVTAAQLSPAAIVAAYRARNCACEAAGSPVCKPPDHVCSLFTPAFPPLLLYSSYPGATRRRRGKLCPPPRPRRLPAVHTFSSQSSPPAYRLLLQVWTPEVGYFPSAATTAAPDLSQVSPQERLPAHTRQSAAPPLRPAIARPARRARLRGVAHGAHPAHGYPRAARRHGGAQARLDPVPRLPFAHSRCRCGGWPDALCCLPMIGCTEGRLHLPLARPPLQHGCSAASSLATASSRRPSSSTCLPQRSTSSEASRRRWQLLGFKLSLARQPQLARAGFVPVAHRDAQKQG